MTLNYKKITGGDQARFALARGMQALADVVGVTLGPKGRHVVLQHRAGLAPLVSKDGIEVARHLKLANTEEEVGLKLLRGAAITLSEAFGDGTTTATLFAADLSLRALKVVEAGANYMAVRQGIGIAAHAALNALAEMTRKADAAALTSIAKTAANGDSRIASLLAEAHQAVGVDGTVEIEIGNSIEDVLEIETGCFFETIPLVRALVPATRVLELAHPYILLCCDEIEDIEELLPALEIARCSNRPLIILADSIGADIETLLVRNRNEGILNAVVMRAPMFGNTRRDALLDLMSRFGGTPFGRDPFVESGLRTLQSLTEEDLGQADQAIIEAQSVTLKGHSNDLARLEERIALVRAELERGDLEVGNSPSGKLHYIEKRKERMKLLSSGCAKLHVGGATDTEIKLRLPLAENALNALRAAAESGVLPGGGVAMIRAVEKIREDLRVLEGDIAVGSAIFLQTLETPIRWIARNAGVRPDQVIARTLADESDFFGFNVTTNTYCDLAENGVLDSFAMIVKVIDVGVSIAGSTLGAGCLITTGAQKPRPESFRGTKQVYDKLMQEGGFDE